MKDRQAYLSARMWLLMLFDGAERFGVAPVSVERLHRLVYMANAMAPVYDLLTPDGYILKFKRGPFYPEVQWDVDRLCAQGLLHSSHLERFRDDGGWWFTAKYGLSRKGMEAVDYALTLDEVGRKSSFLREVVRAFASVMEVSQEGDLNVNDVVLEDLSYEQADPEGPIDFRNPSENITLFAVEAVADSVGDREAVPRRAAIHRYMRYLAFALEAGDRSAA